MYVSFSNGITRAMFDGLDFDDVTTIYNALGEYAKNLTETVEKAKAIPDRNSLQDLMFCYGELTKVANLMNAIIGDQDQDTQDRLAKELPPAVDFFRPRPQNAEPRVPRDPWDQV